MGGTNDKNNLIDLYAHEHFIAHKILAQENPQNKSLVLAWGCMAFAKNESEERYQLTPEEYEEARLAVSKTLKEKYKNKENHPCYGTHLSEEQKQLISKINTGNKYCVNRILSEETKQKIGNANRNPSAETREKMSKARKGKNLGGQNPNAKMIVRLSDNKIYKSIKEAADENKINYSTLRDWVHHNKNYVYYQIWLEQQQ